MKHTTVLSMMVLITGLLPACSYTTHVLSPSHPLPAPVISLDEAAQTLVIEDVQATQNGKAANVDPAFLQRFAFELRRSGLFRAVYYPLTAPDPSQDAVHMQLAITETLDRRWEEKVGKDILVGLSYLTLLPIMPYQMDYTVSLHVTVTVPHQEAREFESSTKAEVEYKGFSDIRAAEGDLKQTALNDCLSGLLAKMKADERFVSTLALSVHRPPLQLPSQDKSGEERLRELKRLRAKGLISPEEYYEKRAKLVEGF